MEMKRQIGTPIPYLLFFCLLTQLHANVNFSPSLYNVAVDNEIKVGVILDMGSWKGKIIHSCIAMALSDFYSSNSQYRTRIVLHTKDSQEDPMHAISAANDLLENVKVQTIIGAETHLEAKVLAKLGDKARVPIFSFSSILTSSSKYPFLVQIKQDEISQFKGIASIIKSYQWRAVNVIYEDSDDGREFFPYLADSLQEANIHIAYKSAISPSSADGQILEEIRKLLAVQPTINVVHMSPSLASRLILNAERLGMMKEGYAWIITDKTTNHLHTLDSEVIESLQGALGLKAYIPATSKLRSTTLRWRKEFYAKDPTIELRKLDVLGIWAYDTMMAIAESAEKVVIEFLNTGNRSTGSNFPDHAYKAASHWGEKLLSEIAGTKFTGLSGEFQILNGKLQSESYVIVNVIGKSERRVGFWTPKEGIVNTIRPSASERHTSSRRGLEAVIWSGVSTTVPKGRFMLTGKKLKIGTANSNGFNELVNIHHDPQTKDNNITGFCIDVFDAAIKSLDYEVAYEFIPFVDENGKNIGGYSYTDLINQVYLQDLDGLVGDMTITANRSMYVDFTLPYTDLGVGTITRRDNNDIWVFSKPLHTNLWLTSAAFFVLLGFVVWAIEHPTNNRFQGSVAYQIGTILWFGFSTLAYAHREKLTSNLSRFVVIIWLFVVLILTSSYTATLSSILTVKQIQLASAVEHIGTQSDSFLGGVIASNLNFKDNHLQQYDSPEAYADALSRGSKHGGVDAIIDEIPYIKIFLSKYGADYAMVASSSTTNGFGFIFQKGSPLVSDMSRAIMKLREEGKLAMMEKAWFKSQSTFMPEDAAATPDRLSLHSFGGLFLLSGVSFVLALLLHFIIKFLGGGRLALIIRFLAPRNGGFFS